MSPVNCVPRRFLQVRRGFWAIHFFGPKIPAKMDNQHTKNVHVEKLSRTNSTLHLQNNLINPAKDAISHRIGRFEARFHAGFCPQFTA